MDAKGFEAIAVLGGVAPDSIPLSKLLFDSDILFCGPDSPSGPGHGPLFWKVLSPSIGQSITSKRALPFFAVSSVVNHTCGTEVRG